MVRIKHVIFCVFIILAVSYQLYAQPKLPFYNFGAEPCEFCLYGDWTAIKTTKIFKRRNSKAKVAFEVKPQEKLTAVTGVVITTKVGDGVALENTILRRYNQKNDTYTDIKIYRNERFYLLTYHGEGIYTVWFKGRVLEAHFADLKLEKRSSPRTVWWVKIRNSKGQTGWTRMTQNFRGPKDI